MHGRRDLQTTMLAVVDLEERVAPNHPPRVIKQFADRALAELSPVFDEMYGAGGRPSIPPERLLKASLLISLYSVRSERAFARNSITTSCSVGFWTWACWSPASTRRCSRRIAESRGTASRRTRRDIALARFWRTDQFRSWTCARQALDGWTPPRATPVVNPRARAKSANSCPSRNTG